MLNQSTNIIWKAIAEYEDNYEVSSIGTVRSKKNGKLLKSYVRHGYEAVSLCKSGIVKKYAVHRLVAITFIDNPNSKPQVNHIDGCKLTNKVSNLEWVTCSENHLHAYRTGLKDPNKACPVIGNNKGKTSNYRYVTYFRNDREERYQASITAKGFTRSKGFSVKKYGEAAELLAAQAANDLIDTYPEFQNRLKNVF